MGQVREVVTAVVRKFFFLSTAEKKVIRREKRLQWRPHLLSLEIRCINKNGYADPDPFWRQKGEVRELQEALVRAVGRRSIRTRRCIHLAFSEAS